MPEINWAVVNNGMDFLASSVELLRTADEKDRRFAALHVYAAIETLVKARLVREHWSLVLADVDKANDKAYAVGDFVSVGATGALKRLRAICGVAVSDDDLSSVAAVAKLRNRVAHFALHEEQPRATEATLARGLNVLLHFISKELLPGADSTEASLINETLEQVREELGKIKALVHERMKTLKSALEGATQPIVVCPGCAQPALELREGDTSRCMYCLYDRDGDVAANDYVATVMGVSQYEVVHDGGEWPVHDCLECGTTAFVQGITCVSGSASSSWGCFECGFHCHDRDVDRCARCNTVTRAEVDGLAVCDSCTDWYMAD